MTTSPSISDFITRWESSGAAERANYGLFLTQLCDLLGVPQPDPTTPELHQNAYVFEREVTFHHPDGTTSIGWIDLYKRGCFVLEAKQGSDQADAEADLARRFQRAPVTDLLETLSSLGQAHRTPDARYTT